MSFYKMEALKRQVLIIKGFSKDKDELKLDQEMVGYYADFFRSIAGGAYDDDEITQLNEPSIEVLKIKIEEEKSDFVVIVFIGHGATQSDSQLFQIRKGEIIQAGQLDLKASKQLIILESCREIVKDAKLPTINLSDKVPNYGKGGVFRPPINRIKAKYLYNNQIRICQNGIVICYACKKDEAARGFIFSKSLLQISQNWHLDSRNHSGIFGIKDLMNATAIKVAEFALKKLNENQTPEILGDINFPFSICKY